MSLESTPPVVIWSWALGAAVVRDVTGQGALVDLQRPAEFGPRSLEARL